MTEWLVYKCNPLRTIVTVGELVDCQIEAWSPVVEFERRAPRSRAMIRETRALLPGLLFFPPEDEELARVVSAMGILGIKPMMVSGKKATVCEREMARFRDRCETFGRRAKDIGSLEDIWAGDQGSVEVGGIPVDVAVIGPRGREFLVESEVGGMQLRIRPEQFTKRSV